MACGVLRAPAGISPVEWDTLHYQNNNNNKYAETVIKENILLVQSHNQSFAIYWRTLDKWLYSRQLTKREEKEISLKNS